MAEQKIYCGNAFELETNFGKITKLNLSKNDVEKILSYMNQNNLKWVNLEVKPKREPEKYKTHSISIDTYKKQ